MGTEQERIREQQAEAARAHKQVPRLPRQLRDLTPVLLVGTGIWVVGLVWFALNGQFGIPFWTCVSGAVLGIAGYGLFRWQRSASRRGVRGAWKGLADLD